MVSVTRSFVLSVALLALSACGLRTSIDSTPYRPLAVGEAYRVTSGMTGLPAAYFYRRPTDRRYRVTVPAAFRAADPETPPAAVEAMAQRTAMCLAAVQPALAGPNGEELEITLVPAVFEGLHPLEVAVTVRPVRGHVRLWQANWSCPEIVHEVGHFLGLVDKYAEPPSLKMYDCRHVGPHSSLMYDPWDAYLRSSPQLEVHRCSCQGLSGETFAACTDALSTIDGHTTACPVGTLSEFKRRTIEYAYPERAAEDLANAGKSASPDGLSKWVVLRRAPFRRNLFSPAEFRVIAHPNAIDMNSRYYACASDAYRTSKRLGGEGCLAAPGCDDGTWAVE